MRIANIIFLLAICSFGNMLMAQHSISATYDEGDIPTSYPMYDSGCNGPFTVIEIELPAIPGDYTVDTCHPKRKKDAKYVFHFY